MYLSNILCLVSICKGRVDVNVSRNDLLQTLPDLDLFAMLYLNGLGDLLDLQHVLDPDSFPDIQKASPEELRKTMLQKLSHCSVLIKVG